MKALIAICGVMLLTACSTMIRTEAPATLFADADFGAAPPELSELDLFALSPAMRDFLAHDVSRYVRSNGAPRGLYEAIRSSLRIDYDAAMTRTAAQTFDAKAGNCLSLVILTAALARSLHVDVRYRFVPRARTWTRTQGMVWENGHVNIELSQRTNSIIAPALIVDFVPTEDLQSQLAQEIDERTVIAMYMNNRAAETLAAGDAGSAYWWARAALGMAPEYAPAYNTLGVIYLDREPQLAERVFRFRLADAPDDPMLLSNLVVALDRQGRTDDAAQVRRQLAALDRYRPFEFLDKGNAAIASGDARTAMKFYREELKHLPYSAELHYAIAVASARLGDVRGAREHLDEAMQLSANLSDRDLYAGKLEKLRARQVH
jgi:Tfp pilus assembly protein PilF